jgi:FkbM family methyltransferase
MKFLLVAKQQKNVSAHLETLQSLVERGHEVTVAVQERDETRDRRLAQQIDSARFKVVPCPSARTDEWAFVAAPARRLRDCVHFLRPPFADSPALQTRVFDKLRQELGLDVAAEALLTALQVLPPSQVGRIEGVLRLAERSIPTSALFNEFLQSHNPDVVLISPLVHFGSAQADVAASARRLGIPVWMLLFSWDNLSTKGCMHVEPDLMFVWNERQRAEAELLHRFPPSRVVVVGATRFDSFFALRPILTREQFHEPLGLDPRRPTLLYLCSSRLIAPQELPFIERWVKALRSSSSNVLRECNVVIRPHPDIALLSEDVTFRRHEWAAAPDLDANIAAPFDDARVVVLRTSYKDPTGLHESLVHSTAVVGLNTTAELEAGIVGRPVFTIDPDAEEGDGPRATLHFHYLTREQGGFVSVASGMEEHLGQLETALAAGVDPAPIRSFIESFVRPHGLDRPVSPLLADALEQHAAAPDVAAETSASVASFDPRALSAGEAAIVPLGYEDARIVVHATAETVRSAAEGAIRLDRATVKWLERWVKIGDVVYDVGAGFGPYVLIAARQRGAVVVAFEPGFKAYSALCDNVLLNGCQGSVIPVPLALASRDAIANIKYDRRHPGEGRHSVQWTRWRMRPADSVQANVHSVCATRLDTAVEQYGLPPANHLRLSASVSAVDVLQGARSTLANESLRSIWLDVTPNEEEAIVNGLGAFGLRVAKRRVRRNAVQIVFSRDVAVAGAKTADGREEIPTG